MFVSAKTEESGSCCGFSLGARNPLLWLQLQKQISCFPLPATSLHATFSMAFSWLQITTEHQSVVMTVFFVLSPKLQRQMPTIVELLHSLKNIFPQTESEKLVFFAFTFNLTRQGSLICFSFWNNQASSSCFQAHANLLLQFHDAGNESDECDGCVYDLHYWCRLMSQSQGVPWAKQRLRQIMLGSLVLRCATTRRIEHVNVLSIKYSSIIPLHNCRCCQCCPFVSPFSQGCRESSFGSCICRGSEIVSCCIHQARRFPLSMRL